MRSDELYHYGVKGQKWGVRRYQNSDGSYTDEGKRRYGRGSGTGRRVGKKKRYSKEDLKEDLKLGLRGALFGPNAAISYDIANNPKKYRAGAYRTLADGRIAPNGRVTKVTRGVIDDYNNMDEKAFRGKYATTKSTYLKRLSKYDDPYKHAKNSGWYKAAKKISKPMLERRAKIRKAMNWTNGDDWQEPGAERIGGYGRKRRR